MQQAAGAAVAADEEEAGAVGADGTSADVEYDGSVGGGGGGGDGVDVQDGQYNNNNKTWPDGGDIEIVGAGSSIANDQMVMMVKKKKGSWTPAEDALLLEFVDKYGDANWNNAHLLFPGLRRGGKSCRMRYRNQLRLGLRKGPFTPAEQLLVCRAVALYGHQWSKIADMLPGRTDNSVKNFWNVRLKRLKRQRSILNAAATTAAATTSVPAAGMPPCSSTKRTAGRIITRSSSTNILSSAVEAQEPHVMITTTDPNYYRPTSSIHRNYKSSNSTCSDAGGHHMLLGQHHRRLLAPNSPSASLSYSTAQYASAACSSTTTSTCTAAAAAAAAATTTTSSSSSSSSSICDLIITTSCIPTNSQDRHNQHNRSCIMDHLYPSTVVSDNLRENSLPVTAPTTNHSARSHFPRTSTSSTDQLLNIKPVAGPRLIIPPLQVEDDAASTYQQQPAHTVSSPSSGSSSCSTDQHEPIIQDPFSNIEDGLHTLSTRCRLSRRDPSVLRRGHVLEAVQQHAGELPSVQILDHCGFSDPHQQQQQQQQVLIQACSSRAAAPGIDILHQEARQAICSSAAAAGSDHLHQPQKQTSSCCFCCRGSNVYHEDIIACNLASHASTAPTEGATSAHIFPPNYSNYCTPIATTTLPTYTHDQRSSYYMSGGGPDKDLLEAFGTLPFINTTTTSSYSTISAGNLLLGHDKGYFGDDDVDDCARGAASNDSTSTPHSQYMMTTSNTAASASSSSSISASAADHHDLLLYCSKFLQRHADAWTPSCTSYRYYSALDTQNMPAAAPLHFTYSDIEGTLDSLVFSGFSL